MRQPSSLAIVAVSQRQGEYGALLFILVALLPHDSFASRIHKSISFLIPSAAAQPSEPSSSLPRIKTTRGPSGRARLHLVRGHVCRNRIEWEAQVQGTPDIRSI
jgi:hypothetical protein